MTLAATTIKVLILETESSLEPLIRTSLEPVNLDIQCEKSIDISVERVKLFCPDLIVIDLNDHGESNSGACSALRAVTRNPLLVVSPFDSPKIVASTLNAGADDYLIKPIQFMELKARIESLLKRSQIKSVQSIPS